MAWELKQWALEVDDFLAAIGKSGAARVLRDLRRMAAEAHLFRGNTRPLRDGIFELKVAHAGMAYRLLYMHPDRTAVFLVCFEKKTQKTPKDKLELALQRARQIVGEEMALGRIELH
jgi:phage-related protein